MIIALDAGVSVNSVENEKDVNSYDGYVLKTSCVSNGKFFPEERKRIHPKDLHRAKLNPQKDRIIISRMNTPSLVGECGYISDDFLNLFLPDRLWMTSHNIYNSPCVQWLSFILSFGSVCKSIKNSATGTSGSMKNISKSDFLSLQIPVPPIKAEQTAIANILSDMDADIASLETKLAKARDVKRGMMQELLTGRIRLI